MRWGAGIAIVAAAVFVTLVLVFPFMGGSNIQAPECRPTRYIADAP
jgi:hypothetical protein